LGAAVISGVIGDAEDTLAIVVIVLLNGVIGFVQEYRAERAVAGLKRLAAANATVQRDGRVLTLPAMVFTVLTLSQMGHVLAIRSEKESLFRLGLWSNRPLLGAVALTFALQLATIYVRPLNPIFKTEPLSQGELALSLLLSAGGVRCGRDREVDGAAQVALPTGTLGGAAVTGALPSVTAASISCTVHDVVGTHLVTPTAIEEERYFVVSLLQARGPHDLVAPDALADLEMGRAGLLIEDAANPRWRVFMPAARVPRRLHRRHQRRPDQVWLHPCARTFCASMLASSAADVIVLPTTRRRTRARKNRFLVVPTDTCLKPPSPEGELWRASPPWRSSRAC
jgi:hypothetical protein